MIKNVVFDFGQVLVHFDPAYMARQYVTNEEDALLLEKVVFDRLYWDALDAGTISQEAVVEACRTRLPSHLWEVAEKLIWNWIYLIPPMEGMNEVVLHLKHTYGVKLFLLSNISLYFAEHACEFPILAEMDRCIFSSVCGYTKPSKEIFAYLCESCEIDPAQTLFVDDNAANVAAAEKMGIKTYHFDGNAAKLREYLDELLK